MAGVTTVSDGYYNIFLGVGAYDFRNVHHEIWHAMEYRITAEYPDVFDSWDDLNPAGFEYADDYFSEDIWTYAEPNLIHGKPIYPAAIAISHRKFSGNGEQMTADTRVLLFSILMDIVMRCCASPVDKHGVSLIVR